MTFYIFGAAHENSKNPYLFNLKRALINLGMISHNEYFPKLGVIDFFRNIRTGIWIINWPENIYSNRFGFFQSIIYIFIMFLIGRYKKIVWIYHNKYSHHNSNLLSRFCQIMTAKFSYFTITHSESGKSYYIDRFNLTNIYYFQNPIYQDFIADTKSSILFDYIIWGEIVPYKKLQSFLEFDKNTRAINNKKILICGKCKDEKYLTMIKNLLSDNIILIDEHLNDNALSYYIHSSRCILFTKYDSSLISSGALIYSISFDKCILGPAYGIFHEFKTLNMIDTYNDYDDLINYSFQKPDLNARKSYCTNYNWDSFAQFISNKILEKK